MRVAVEGGQVKYLRNGVVVGVSSRAVTYPLVADAALYNTGASLTNVVLSGTVQSGSAVQWLVTDHLGTPRIVIDLSGSLEGIKRHDYLPFGEEIRSRDRWKNDRARVGQQRWCEAEIHRSTGRCGNRTRSLLRAFPKCGVQLSRL